MARDTLWAMDVHTPLPCGLVAELLPKLRRLTVDGVMMTHQGFIVSYRHKNSDGQTVTFRGYYVAHPAPKGSYGGKLQTFSYEGNGVHVLKFARHAPLAGTLVECKGLTFATPLAVK